MEVKLIDGKEVRRLITWPNYGITKCGKPYRWDTERPMTIQLHGGAVDGTDPYYVFRVSHGNVVGHAYLHKAVAEAWLLNDDPENKTQVNHKDGNKLNFDVDNLEWVTPSQNQRHALLTNLKQKGENLYNAGLLDDQVHIACQCLRDGWRVKDVADRFMVSTDIIRKLRAGDTYFHIRRLYNIDIKNSDNLSESTVRWVCENILKGCSDSEIARKSTNKNLTTIGVKRIRNKTRYSLISDEYF